MKAGGGLAVVVAIGTFAAACTIMNGLELPAGVQNGDGGRSSSSGNSGDGGQKLPEGGTPTRLPDGGAGCALKHPPAKVAADPGGTDTMFAVALESMLSANASQPLGYDLDGLCTCPDPAPCTSSAATACDVNGDGTDNAGNAINAGLTQFGFNPVEQANDRIAEGIYGLLIRVVGYNQQPNDDSVQVTIMRSKGIDGGPNFNNAPEVWPASQRTGVSTTGWVTGSTLVASFDSVEVPFLDNTISPAKMQHATLIGTLAAGPTMSSALLVGRAPTNDMIQSIGELDAIPDDNDNPICQQSLYASFGSQACGRSDISLDPNNDATGTAACDAFSLALSMTLKPATIGPVAPIPPVPERCSGVTPIQCH